jgi:hypothetical protein
MATKALLQQMQEQIAQMQTELAASAAATATATAAAAAATAALNALRPDGAPASRRKSRVPSIGTCLCPIISTSECRGFLGFELQHL